MNSIVSDSMKRILLKLTSARFIIAIVVTLTLCWSVGKCLQMVLETSKDEKAFSLVKDIVMYLLGSFTSVVTASVISYFNRNDRMSEDERERINRGG